MPLFCCLLIVFMFLVRFIFVLILVVFKYIGRFGVVVVSECVICLVFVFVVLIWLSVECMLSFLCVLVCSFVCR